MDSGASHHMTGDLTLLSDVRGLPYIEEWLPDGNSVVAVREGKLCLLDNFNLNRQI